MKTVRFLFNDAMARAIVEGRKTVTRRPVTGVDGYGVAPCHFSSTGFASVERVDGQSAGRCICSREVKPPCATGDMLIGRECWRVFGGISEVRVDYRAGGASSTIGREVERVGGALVHYLPDVSKLERPGWKWRPSIHMPDWAARIRRRVVSVTVERLQDVTIQDAVREGFPTRHDGTDARNDFLCAWDDIYLNRGLASAVNPWVWRIEFSRENVVQDGTP